MDAVAVAMINPGPVVITAAFIGYMIAGILWHRLLVGLTTSVRKIRGNQYCENPVQRTDCDQHASINRTTPEELP